MNQNKLSFANENLVVDYISFKFRDLDDSTKTKLVNYLFKKGFNSIERSRKLADPIKKEILATSKKKFHVTFDIDYPYWIGTVLQISKQSATFFYQLVKKQSIDWRIFSSGILSRFDLYYFRANKPDDKISNRDFMHECNRALESSPRNVETIKTSTGVTLYIGNRKADHSCRMYIKKEKEDCLKFEYEMKKNFLRKYHILLTSYQLEEFEHDLSLCFFRYFGKLELPLKHSQFDWLFIKLRPLRKHKSFLSRLRLDYIEAMDQQLVANRQKFFTFLQFIVYAQTLDYKPGALGD